MKKIIKQRKIIYIAYISKINSKKSLEEIDPGVLKKIKNTVDALNELGNKTTYKIYGTKFIDIIISTKKIINNKDEIIIFRMQNYILPILFPIFLYKRLRGTKLIIDIPTPRWVQINELKNFDNLSIKILLKILIIYISWSWILIPFNRIIQYSDENKWFSFGVTRKTIKCGNGIKIDKDLPIIKPNKKNNTLNIICVSTMAPWHGYDRLLLSIAKVRKVNPTLKITLNMVGDGPVLSDLIKLTENLNLMSFVKFSGPLSGKSLDHAFDSADIGVASLGLFRIGLQEAAVLKTREYMARGMCVIAAGRDPDFELNSPFRFVVSNDENNDTIVELLLKLYSISLPNPSKIREFAEKELCITKKIDYIISQI